MNFKAWEKSATTDYPLYVLTAGHFTFFVAEEEEGNYEAFFVNSEDVDPENPHDWAIETHDIEGCSWVGGILYTELESAVNLFATRFVARFGGGQ